MPNSHDHQRHVGVFRTVYPLVSETFIREQVGGLREWAATMIVRDACTPESEAAAVSPRNKFARLAWTATRSPWAYNLKSLSNLDLIHAHFGPDGLMILPTARKLNVPLLTTFHGVDVTVDRFKIQRRVHFTEKLFWKHEPELKQFGAKFIAVSKFIEGILKARGYPEEKIVQHYIGVDTNKFKPAPRLGDCGRYILCVGRHTSKKGIDDLLKAWGRIASSHPDVQLVQVGGGPSTQKLKDLASECGIASRVTWLGPRGHSEVLELMQQAEVFCLPSKTAPDGDSEALGIVFNEAAACGIPVVSTRHGGIPEAVQDGTTGLLVKEGDFCELAERLSQVLSNPELRLSMGHSARQLALERFNLTTQSKRLESIYSDALDGVI